VVQQGSIVETGSHAELLQQGGLYSELYHIQFRGGEDTERPRPDQRAVTLASASETV